MEIKLKSVREKHVVYITTTGHYHQIPKIFGELMKYIAENNIHILEHPYCTFFNNTLEVPPQELHYEIGIPFTGGAPEEGNVNIKKIAAHQVVSTIYEGAYKQTERVYLTLMEYALSNGYLITGPVTEIYLNNPEEVNENKLLTEVQFPVMKK